MNKYILESSAYQIFKTINHGLDAITQIDVSDDISMIAFSVKQQSKIIILKDNGTEYEQLA